MWVPEGSDRHTAPNTHTIMSYNLVPLQCCSPALCSALCSLPEARVPTAVKRCSAGHSQIVARDPLSFVCLVWLLLLIGLFTNTSYAAASLKKKKKGLPQKAMGITIKPWVLYSTSFLQCLRCLHIYNIFLTSLSGPKQTAHGLGSNLSGSQCS